MEILAVLYAPLVNVASTVLRAYAPRIPKAVMPLVNIGFGIGVGYLGQLIGAPGLESVDPNTTGVLIGGGATVLYDSVHQAKKLIN